MVDWEIYYNDESTFSDEDGGPGDAPGSGVVAIVCKDSLHEWVIVSREDYYIYRHNEGEWYGVDINGLWDYLNTGGNSHVKFGRTIATKEFQRIHEIAATSKRDMFDRKKQRRYPDMPHELPP